MTEYCIYVIARILSETRLSTTPLQCRLPRNEIETRSAVLLFCSSEDNLWSPWFRIIVERFAREWWLNLNDAISTDKYMDTVNIHRFDPPSKHRGGAGVTGLLEEGAKAATIDK